MRRHACADGQRHKIDTANLVPGERRQIGNRRRGKLAPLARHWH